MLELEHRQPWLSCDGNVWETCDLLMYHLYLHGFIRMVVIAHKKSYGSPPMFLNHAYGSSLVRWNFQTNTPATIGMQARLTVCPPKPLQRVLIRILKMPL